MSIDISESIELHNSYLHKSLSITNPRHFHRKRVTSTKKGQHRIYQLAIKEMRKMNLSKSNGEQSIALYTKRRIFGVMRTYKKYNFIHAHIER